MLKLTHAAFGTAALCIAFTALAQKPVTFPAKGQSAAQQQKDDGECYTWAKGNTGIDPAAVAAAPPAPPPEAGPAVGGGQRAGGAVKGAAVGAIIGDSSEAAGKGAAVGVIVGGAKARQQKREQAQAQGAQQQQAQQQTMATFYKAYGACMEGHGYTVK